MWKEAPRQMDRMGDVWVNRLDLGDRAPPSEQVGDNESRTRQSPRKGCAEVEGEEREGPESRADHNKTRLRHISEHEVTVYVVAI